MAYIPYDILLDENNELLFKDGDFVIGDSTQQILRLTIQLNPGNLLFYPTVGVGIDDYILSKQVNTLNLLSAIRVQLNNDNFNIKTLEYNQDGSINIEATKIK